MNTLEADNLGMETLSQDCPDVRALLLQRLNKRLLHQHFALNHGTHYGVNYGQDITIYECKFEKSFL